MLREHQSPIAYEKIMKCPKTLCAAAIAATMIATMGSSVWAAETTTTITGPTTNTGNTTLTYEVAASYEWVVPSSITFEAGSDADKTEKTSEVKVTKNVIAENKTLKITAKGDGSGDAFTIQNDAQTPLTYSVKVDNTEIQPNDTVLTVASGTNAGTASLIFTLTKHSSGKNAEVPGTYKGTVTYTSTVVDTSSLSN